MIDNLKPHIFNLTRHDKEKLLNTQGIVFWLTGLSGSGKSTIANEFQRLLFNYGMHSIILDGDDVRSGLCKDLDFSQIGREENLRRVSEVAKIFAKNGCITLCCFITPLEKQRKLISEIVKSDFVLVHVSSTLKICEERDPKGLYRKARNGEIKDFTGIDSVYENPRSVELVLDTLESSPKMLAQELFDFYQKKVSSRSQT